MSKDILYSSLLELNLDPLSCNVYISLLKENKLTVTDLGKKFGVQRWKIYECLEKLIKLGLIKELQKYSREIIVYPPTSILPKLQKKEMDLKEKIENFTNLIPSLLTEFQNEKGDFIRVYDSKVQLENLLENLLESKEEAYFGLGDYENWYNYLGDKFTFSWNSKRSSLGTNYKILGFPSYVINEAKATNLKNNKEIKVLPSSFKTEGFLLISKKQIIQWNPVLPKAIVIEDIVLSKLYQNIFQIIWSLT